VCIYLTQVQVVCDTGKHVCGASYYIHSHPFFLLLITIQLFWFFNYANKWGPNHLNKLVLPNVPNLSNSMSIRVYHILYKIWKNMVIFCSTNVKWSHLVNFNYKVVVYAINSSPTPQLRFISPPSGSSPLPIRWLWQLKNMGKGRLGLPYI
jgi:hypothetical protein